MLCVVYACVVCVFVQLSVYVFMSGPMYGVASLCLCVLCVYVFSYSCVCIVV